MPGPRPLLYLIDASSYVYRAFFALPPLSSPTGLPTNAAYGVTTMLLKLLRDTQPRYVGAVFDAPGPTFRDDLFADYKANRAAMPDDLAAQVPLVHELIATFGIRSFSVPGVEADDVIGTLSAAMARASVDTVIISGDKDLLQLVGPSVQLWDTMRDRRYDVAAVRDRFGVAPEQIVDVLGLMGDSIDNIPGVKGIGEKTAVLLVQRFGSIAGVLDHLDAVAALTDLRGAKRVAGLLRDGAEMARLSRTLALVRRDLDIDVTLESFRYHPPSPNELRPLFTRLGFQSLLSGLLRTGPPPSVTVCAAPAADAVAALGAAAHAAGALALACGPDGVVVSTTDHGPMLVAAEDPVLSAALTDPAIEKVAHDLKRDLALLSGPVPDPAFDVMVASYLLEATPTHRLEDLAADVLDTALPAFRIDLDGLGKGVSLLLPLRARLAPRLAEAGLDHLFRAVEMPLVAVLSAMERRGVRVDVAALRALGADLDARVGGLVREIHELAGGEFNIGSPAQLREVLFERLQLPRRGVRRGKTGLSTDVDVLTRLAESHPLPAKILEYRSLTKLKSTYVDALLAAVDPGTGRLHTSFNQTVTVTGRLSSSDPNLQNIPIRGEEGRRIRAAFIAADGYRLIAADYSQIELRLLAHLSADPVLLAAFGGGEDIHARTAAEVFGVLPGTVTADMRRAAKVINFGILYGMGPQRLARELRIPLREAEQYIANYFHRYAGVRRYLDETIARARTEGYVTTVLGRRRSLPDLVSRDRAVMQAAERTAANTPIQGSAADLMKVAMVAIDRRLRAERLDAALILQVHDEVVLEAAAEHCPAAVHVVRDEMERALSLRVPLTVDVGVGLTWAEAHP